MDNDCGVNCRFGNCRAFRKHLQVVEKEIFAHRKVLDDARRKLKRNVPSTRVKANWTRMGMKMDTQKRMDAVELPHSDEAEAAVIGAAILDRDAAATALRLLKPDHFYRDANRAIFAAMAEVKARVGYVEMLTLVEHMKAGGAPEAALVARLGEYATRIPTAANIEAHCAIVLDKAKMRALRETLYRLEESIPGAASADDLLAVAAARFAAIETRASGEPAPRGRVVKVGEHLTDLGNAERLVRRHGASMRYCCDWQSWLIWDGRRWRRDDSARARAFAIDTVRAIYGEARDADDSGDRKRLGAWATKSEAEGGIRAMLSLAQVMVAVTPDALDRDPWALNVKNGIIDLRTGALAPHDPARMITKLAPIAFDPDARAPEWIAFLRRVMADNDDMIGYLRRKAGYSLTGVTDERIFSILHGGGSNGKSTFLEVLAATLGDYACRTPTSTLMARRDGEIPNDVARLKGMRFVYASESKEGRRLDEERVKDMTGGGDKISARFMRGEWFDFVPEFKLWLSTNHKPNIHGTDDGIWDRVRLVPFAVRIGDADKIPKSVLLAQFAAEAAGILAWMVRGCLEWRAGGIGTPAEVRVAGLDMRAEMDALADFIDEHCTLHPDAWAASADLYAQYAEARAEEREKPMSRKQFAQRLIEKGFVADRASKGVRVWKGIALKA